MGVSKKIKNFLKNLTNTSGKITYKTISANSFIEALRLNGFSINKTNDTIAETIYLNLSNFLEKEIDFEYKQKGGIITFSNNITLIKSHRKNSLIM